MVHLFAPLTIKSITLRNRIGVSPMCMYSSEDGAANDWHLVHLGARAAGGAGLIIAEATAVAPEGRITPGDAGIWADKHVEPLARINRFVKAQGAVPGIQLAHAGRKASAARPWDGSAHLANIAGGWDTIAPSAIAFGGGLDKVPRAMTREDIARVQRDFVAAAQRSLTAGYAWLELHAAHGYLLQEFLSPLANQRTDDYGGSFENRTRFLRETTEAVRAVWPESLPLTVRLSTTEWVEGGWTIEDSIVLTKQLQQLGCDYICCTSGGVVREQKIDARPDYQVPFAEAVRRATGIATMATGQITGAQQAEKILTDGQADMVAIARRMMFNPRWPWHAALELGDFVMYPERYRTAHPLMGEAAKFVDMPEYTEAMQNLWRLNEQQGRKAG